jgi:hypothetical protein
LEPVREGEIFKGRLLDLKRLFGMLLQGLAGVPIFDVVDYVKLLERNEGIVLASANTWEELVQRLSAASPAGKGYGFEAVYNRITGLEPVREGEIFKGRLLDLKRLFGMLLVR